MQVSVLRLFLFRGIAQLVEQWSPKPRAEGSNPSAPAKRGYAEGVLSYAVVAQSVEHILGKDEVGRSIRLNSSI